MAPEREIRIQQGKEKVKKEPIGSLTTDSREGDS